MLGKLDFFRFQIPKLNVKYEVYLLVVQNFDSP